MSPKVNLMSPKVNVISPKVNVVSPKGKGLSIFREFWKNLKFLKFLVVGSRSQGFKNI